MCKSSDISTPLDDNNEKTVLSINFIDFVVRFSTVAMQAVHKNPSMHVPYALISQIPEPFLLQIPDL